MEGRGRSRARKQRWFSPKRLTSFLLAAAMVCTNIGSDLSTAYAAGASTDVTFEMRGADLTAAVEEAIASENVVAPDDLNFTNGNVDDFNGYLFGEGKLYEAYPEMEGGDVETNMRVFVRVPEDADDMYAMTGDEEVIFLYINNSEDTVQFRSRITYTVNGEEKVKTTDRITVRSYESVYGDEEVNVISEPVNTEDTAENAADTTAPSEPAAETPETEETEAPAEESPEADAPETEAPAEDPVATESEMTASISKNEAALVAAPAEKATPSELPEEEETTEAETEESAVAEETGEEPETEAPEEEVPEAPKATESEIPETEKPESAPKPDYSDLVGIGWSGTAKLYTSTLNKLHALDDVEGWKVEYSITPAGSARIVDGPRGVEDGEDLYFGVKNQIGYAVETVLANGEELTADTVIDNEDGSQTAWYAVYGVTEEQSVDVVMAETGEHPAFEQTITMDDGMVITLKAGEGVLPEGVTATAERVSQEVEATVIDSASAEGKDIVTVYLYDINLWLGDQLLDSEIWGGSKKVEVTFSGAPMEEATEEASTVEVLHVETVQDSDQEAKEKAATQEEEIKAEDVLGIETVSEVVEVPADETVDAISFEAEHFTVYGLAVARANTYVIGVSQTQELSVDSGGYSVTWRTSDKEVASVQKEWNSSSATVTGNSPGDAIITASWGWGNKQTFYITVIEEGSYSLYCYGLIPGIDLNDNRPLNEKWMGFGVGTISGENLGAPSDYDNNTFIGEELYTYELPEMPDITYDGKIYVYAEPNSPEATQEGHYTVQWIRVVTASGANTGANGVNPEVDSNIDTFHLDGQILLVENNKYNVMFRIQQPGESYFALAEGYSVLVDEGMSENRLSRPDTAPKTHNGVTYIFDGWYYDENCTEKADFSGRITENTTYYGKYVPQEEDVTVYIIGNTATKSYNGNEQSVTGFTTSDLPENISIKLRDGESAIASGTDVGTYNMNLTSDMFEVIDNNPSVRVNLVIREDGKLEITPRNITVTISGAQRTVTYTGEKQTATGFSSDAPEDVRVAYIGEGENPSVSGINAGTYKMVLHEEDFTVTASNLKNYNITVNVVDGWLKINPTGEELVVTITGNNASKVYTGSEQKVEGFTSNAPANVSVVLAEGSEAKASGTVVGHYLMGLTEEDFVVTSDNYSKITVKVVDGYLDITPIESNIIITAGSDSKTYDGTALTESGYSYTEGVLLEGDILTAEISGSQTDAGQSANVVTGYRVMREDLDVTQSYTFGKSVDGILTVEPRKIVLTSESAEKKYDATPLTASNISVSGDGFVDGEGATYTVTGSQTEVGSSKNTFTYELTDNTKAENYEITPVFGTLTVTIRDNLHYEVHYYYYDADGNMEENPDELIRRDDGVFGAVIEYNAPDVTTYKNQNYVLLRIDTEGQTIQLNSEENIVNVFYALDEVGDKNPENPENPDIPDNVPDMYQVEVTYEAVNGTVDVTGTQYVTIYENGDPTGNWATPSEMAWGHLTEEQIADATAAVGYDQTTELWTLGGRPTVKPDTESQIAEDRHYVITFEKGMYGYKVVEHYENADGVEIGTIETTGEAVFEEAILELSGVTVTQNKAYGENNYTLTKVDGYDKLVSADETQNEVHIYYALDEIGGGEDPNKPDDVPDKYQLVFTYVPADPTTGNVTGKTVEVKTFTDEAGNYIDVQPTSPVTMDGHGPVPEGNSGYAFAYWTVQGGDENVRDYTKDMSHTLGQATYIEDTVFEATFLEDKGGTEDPDTPDGKPDIYQIKFTYVTEDPQRGTFNGVNEVSEVLNRPTNDDGSTNMDAGVKPTVGVTITENGRYRFDHWTDPAGTEYTTEELQNAAFTTDTTFTAHFRYVSGGGHDGGSSGSGGGGNPYNPSTGGPGEVLIDEGNVPLAPLPTEGTGTTIYDGDVPLAPLPKTGQQSSKTPVMMLLTRLVRALASLTRRKEEKQ